MRGYARVVAGNLVIATLCLLPGPIGLAVAYSAWNEGESWAWIALVVGLVCTLCIPFAALKAARGDFPRITRGDRVKDRVKERGKGAGTPRADDAFVIWGPRSPTGHPRARLARADVLEASLVRYAPEGEATFTTCYGDYTPDEFTPLVRLRLRVHGAEGAVGAGPAGEREGAERGAAATGFEITGEWRVPALFLSAVTAGRLAVLVGPAGEGESGSDGGSGAESEGGSGAGAVPVDSSGSPSATPSDHPSDHPSELRAHGPVVPLWPRSALLAGTRTCRVIDLDGRVTDVTRHPVRQLRQMRVSRSVGGVELVGDTIDLRRLDPHTAARYTAVAEQDRAFPEDRAPVTEPGEEARWIVDRLPGAPAAFGSVPRRWSRRGGVLVLGRFLEMRATHTFQDHGPVLHTVLRLQPADGTPPFDVTRRLTVPLDYLAVLHRTREVVLRAAPTGSSYDVDWARTNLLAGTTAAAAITPDGRELPLAGRPDVIWSLMNLLAAHGLSNRGPVLDLRERRMSAVAGPALEVLRRASAVPAPGASAGASAGPSA
ncbi:hypothetical protein AB0399_36235 [Streptomyces sp. NPDC088194]|uniref:hypothetical protein n=1 Tax=Streptomyces sp. NPDC088194 TaxID=3154931 RepID=UPI00344B1A2B